MSPAFWVAGACVIVVIIFIGTVTLDGYREGEYQAPRSHHKPRRRLHRPSLPRRPARLTPADAQTVTWVTALNAHHHPGWAWHELSARIAALGVIIAHAQIPPTETPEPRLDYDDTNLDWAEIRKDLGAMLAADGGD